MGSDPPALRGAEPGSRGAVSPRLRVEILGHLVAFRYLYFLKVVNQRTSVRELNRSKTSQGDWKRPFAWSKFLT